jgi:hypothetical protein
VLFRLSQDAIETLIETLANQPIWLLTTNFSRKW